MGSNSPGNLGVLENMIADTEYTIKPFTGKDTGEAASTNPDNVFDVTLNSNGPFFETPNGNLTATSYGPNAAGADVPFTFGSVAVLEAAIILHELGHEVGVLPSDVDPAVNGQNSASILQNCFTNVNRVWQ